jgi:hypothetical protein
VKQYSIEAAILEGESTAIRLLKCEFLTGPASSLALAMNTGEGSTPTACETSGKFARKRVTAPVPQPISSTSGKGDLGNELVEYAPSQKVGCAKL